MTRLNNRFLGTHLNCLTEADEYPPTMLKSKVRKGIPLQTSIKVGYKASLYNKGKKGHVIRKPVMCVSDKYLHKPSCTTTGDELRIRKEGLHYLRSENNMRLCLCICIKAMFLMIRLICHLGCTR